MDHNTSYLDPNLNIQAREYMIESYRNEERDRERLNDAKDIQREIEKTMMDEILNKKE